MRKASRSHQRARRGTTRAREGGPIRASPGRL